MESFIQSQRKSVSLTEPTKMDANAISGTMGDLAIDWAVPLPHSDDKEEIAFFSRY